MAKLESALSPSDQRQRRYPSSRIRTGRRRGALVPGSSVGMAAVLGAVLSAPGVASAVPSTTVSTLSGYVLVEADVAVPAGSLAEADAYCPDGDVVLGGGGYQNSQNIQESLSSSAPHRIGHYFTWDVDFANAGSQSTTGVAVAFCATKRSIKKYSVVTGATVSVSADSDAEALVSCPSGTVSLGGGWTNLSPSTVLADGATSSAPDGTNGWRTWLTAGPDGSEGQATTVCAKQPAGWTQVYSSYRTIPSNSATTVSVDCPPGTKVVGGGSFNRSTDPLVMIGLTDSPSSLNGWQSAVNNRTDSRVSADAWGICAT